MSCPPSSSLANTPRLTLPTALATASETPPSEVAFTPDSTAAHTPESSPRKASHSNRAEDMNEAKMEASRGLTTVETEVTAPKVVEEEAAVAGASGNTTAETPASKDTVADSTQKEKAKTISKQKKKSKLKCKQKKHKSKSKKLTPSTTDADADDDSDSEVSDSDADASNESDSDSDSSSDEEEKKKKKSKAKKKQKAKDKAAAKKKAKKDKKKKKKKADSSDSDSDSDSSSDSDSDDASKRKRRKRQARKVKVDPISEEDPLTEDQKVAESEEVATEGGAQLDLQQLMLTLKALGVNAAAAGGAGTTPADTAIKEPKLAIKRKSLRLGRIREPKVEDKPQEGEVAFKRVDQIWDKHIHDYRIQETAKEQVDPFDGYVFHVRRRFDWENKYRHTMVDIKSKFLRDALQEVMKDVRAVSLVENEPSIDPNMLFLYLEEMRVFYKTTLKERIKKEKKKKLKKRAKIMREHLKLLVGYLDKDYESTKKNLDPLLKAGNITFDLLWALFKPNTIAYTTTYGSNEEPRCVKVDQGYKEKTFMRGEFYVIEGRYLEYDGKTFGLGDLDISIDHFKGPKKITSLAAYPLQYHKDPDAIRKQLIERGKKFVSLAGMNFKLMKGLAFMKKKKQVLKFNVNGRVMVDPKTFRRENANYQVSSIHNNNDSDDESDDDACSCEDDDDDERDQNLSDDGEDSGKVRFKIVVDENNKTHLVEANADDDEDETMREEHLDKLNSSEADDLGKKREFTEEELLIASSVVLGFSFVEKQWFEFSVSGIGDIVWDDGAFDSLVLPPNHKSIVKAQVCSHKFHGGETIDDVIQGKGKGLVFVLHGPPGVGKTLTAEGIAEFLRCPLYAVSAGDLGTDARIEHELNKIMTIAHSWGAVLLLDEADVFLEKRQHQDVHRNALVSVFLRLLEYFQGILFLTTNRVQTFDEAFQSRIHIALKYSELGAKAKKEIWKMFISKVKETGSEVAVFKETDYDRLAKSNLNGRQIKNMVKTAQALAVFEKTPLNMEHVRRVLDVGESFERDLKGGTGYEDAMRSYT